MSPNDSTFDPREYAGNIHLILAEALGRHMKDPAGLAGIRYLEEQLGTTIESWFSSTIGLLAVAGNLINELVLWKLTAEGVRVEVDENGRIKSMSHGGNAEDLIDRWVDGYKLAMMEKLMEDDDA